MDDTNRENVFRKAENVIGEMYKGSEESYKYASGGYASFVL